LSTYRRVNLEKRAARRMTTLALRLGIGTTRRRLPRVLPSAEGELRLGAWH